MTLRSTRRRFLAATAAGLAAPSIAGAAADRLLRFVPHADLTVVDPGWTTAYITRNHALLVYDTLWGTDAGLNPQYQMLAGHRVEDDGKTWILTLRDGLRFHDGEPVRAQDVAASIRRWGQRDSFGQTVLLVTDALEPVDDKTLRIRLKRPFPLLAHALGKAGSSVCAILPERLATSDRARPITEVIGSGPYRYKPLERVPGARVVYERNPDYVPRPDGAASFTAGPKIAHFDRVEWHILAEAATAGAALQSGEVDWWEAPSADLLPLLRRNKALEVKVHDKTGILGFMRMNHDIPPFNNPAIRRAVLGAISQEDFMSAVAGSDPANWHTPIGFFAPDSPVASEVGLDVFRGKRDYDRVKREIAAAGYKGEKVVVMVPSDNTVLKAAGEVGADCLSRAGFNVDAQYLEWGALVQRLARFDGTGQNSWNIYHSYWSGLDQANPAVNASLRANGKALGRPGMAESPTLEAMRDQWLAATSPEDHKRIAREIQLQAFQDLPYIPVGQAFMPMAYRGNVKGVLDGFPLFWNVRKDG